jgi:ankyrin repeat protein
VQVEIEMDTELIKACKANDTTKALELIAEGNIDIGAQDGRKATALGHAIVSKNEIIINALLATGKSNPGAQNVYRRTVLMYVCDKELQLIWDYNYSTSIALALIATGKSNPGVQDNFGWTALVYACMNNLTDVALALIKTGESNPGVQDNCGWTALMYACKNNLTDVALALIKTGESNLDARCKKGTTALDLAKKGRMYAVFQELAYMRRRIVITGEYADYY